MLFELMLISSDSYFAAGVLNPHLAYIMTPTNEIYRMLKDAFGSMTDVHSAVQALQEAEVFRQKLGEFASDMAMKMAMDPKTTPCNSSSVRHCYFLYSNILLTESVSHAAAWWMMFGSSTPQLQRLALRLVTQCVSSNGCERNWYFCLDAYKGSQSVDAQETKQACVCQLQPSPTT